MAELDPAVLGDTLTLLNNINTTLSQVTDKVKNVVNLLPGASSAISANAEAHEEASTAATTHATAASGLGKATEEVAKTSKETAAYLETLSNKYTKNYQGIVENVDALKKNLEAGKLTQRQTEFLTNSFSLLGVAIFNTKGALGSFDSELKAIGQDTATNTAEAIAGLKNNLGLLGNIPGMGGIVKGFTGLIDVFAKFNDASTSVRNLENQLISARGAFGGFKDASREDFIENLRQETVRYNEIIIGTGQATNTTAAEVQKYANQLMKIPGAFDAIIPGAGKTGTNMRLLEEAMRVSRGTTGDFTDATDAINLQFRQFGETTESSLDYMSRIYEMSQNLGIAFKDFKTPVENIVKSFSALGDTSKSATQLVAGLSQSLMKTGIGIEPTQRIIGGITESMTNMNLAQKAFLSQQTGGAGGLQGAFQIDQMIAEGDIKGVYERMEKALRQQFGGRITTLQEASQDQNASAQMAKQVAFLRQSPFGSMMKNDQDAYKYLEAMRSGTGPSQELLDSGKDALQGSLDTSEKIQAEQRDALISIMNATNKMARDAILVSADDLRMREKANSITRTEGEQPNIATMASAPGIASGKQDEMEYKGMSEVMASHFDEARRLLFNQGDKETVGPGTIGLKQDVANHLKRQMNTNEQGLYRFPERSSQAQESGIITPQVSSELPPNVIVNIPEKIQIVLTDISGRELLTGTGKPDTSIAQAISGASR